MEELIIGEQYHLWVEDTYIGMGTFVDDPNIGKSFINLIVHAELGIVRHVLPADRWELVNKN